tara:strand:+ start:335 stop:571 length:237 start_codon:yes stop_codon:yes gene_type:complete
MTLLLIKMIFIIPLLIFAVICGGIGNLLNRIPYIFAPFVFVLYKLSSFLMDYLIKDLLHSAKGTPLEKYLDVIKKEEL